MVAKDNGQRSVCYGAMNSIQGMLVFESEQHLTRSASFEVARFESREATSADSLGRKPKDWLGIVLLAAKRRQQSARQQFAAAASRLSKRFQHFSAGLRPQLSADVASRLNSATSKSVSEGERFTGLRDPHVLKRSPSPTLRVKFSPMSNTGTPWNSIRDTSKRPLSRTSHTTFLRPAGSSAGR